MKGRDLVVLGLGLLGAYYLLRKRKAPERAPSPAFRLGREIAKTVQTITHKEMSKLPAVRQNIVTHQAITNLVTAQALIHAYADPQLNEILPTEPSKLKLALAPLTEPDWIPKTSPRFVPY